MVALANIMSRMREFKNRIKVVFKIQEIDRKNHSQKLKSMSQTNFDERKTHKKTNLYWFI